MLAYRLCSVVATSGRQMIEHCRPLDQQRPSLNFSRQESTLMAACAKDVSAQIVPEWMPSTGAPCRMTATPSRPSGSTLITTLQANTDIVSQF